MKTWNLRRCCSSSFMKKLVFICFWLTALFGRANASHITGGEMSYRFVGITNGQYKYEVTLKLYQRCNSGRPFPNPAIIPIFNKTNNARVVDLNVNIGNTDNISITDPDPCITNPPAVCYDVAYYTFTIILPASASGYVLASQVNYRIAGISNLSPGYNNVGATYTADIPGTSPVMNGPENNSAKFIGNDLVIVCANNNFSYSFAAQDDDGDELNYFFCEAYASTSTAGGNPMPTNPPPFPPVPYKSPDFSGTKPLGNIVQVDPNTGLITGIAPPSGIYVVTVCVQEIRNGQIIATQRKDMQIFIAECTIASASLLPEYLLCRNTQTITLTNQSSSPLIFTQDWEVIDNTGTIIAASTGIIFNYTFLPLEFILLNSSSTGINPVVIRQRPLSGYFPGLFLILHQQVFVLPTRFFSMTGVFQYMARSIPGNGILATWQQRWIFHPCKTRHTPILVPE